MKKIILSCLALVALTVVLTSATQGDAVMTKDKGVYVVNTTQLATDVKGYMGATPLKVYIKKNKIEKIEALPNQETPRYWARVKNNLLDKWNGMTVKQVTTTDVDVVTGATFSSNAVKENVRRAVDYYNTHK